MRVNVRFVLLATILTAATACDKARAFIRAGRDPAPPTVAPNEALTLRVHPDLLFEVFGDASDPRMIPIAALDSGPLRRINLSAAGWHELDAMYLRPGKSYTLYSDGRAAGSVVVQHGMWENPTDPLYSLPGCQALTPLAAVTVKGAVSPSAFTVEYLASSAQLGGAHQAASLSPAQVEQIARAVGRSVAMSTKIDPHLLESLDFHAVAFASGVGPWPTIVASFIDPAAENATSTSQRTVHLLIVADRDSTGAYHPTFIHRVNGALGDASFRRYFDHIDLNSDGTDEIVLEGWEFGHDAFLIVLGWHGGKWGEIFRARATWCLDERADRS